MMRKFMLAVAAAMSLGVAVSGGSTEALANPWGGYGGPPHGYYGAPPPWARPWGWRGHHRWGGHHGHWGRPWGGPPAYGRPAPPHYPHARPFAGRGYGPY